MRCFYIKNLLQINIVLHKPYLKGTSFIFLTLKASTEFLNIGFTEIDFNNDKFKILD